MEFSPTKLPDVQLIKPNVFSDQRGFFVETYREALFRKHGIPYSFVQDNHSLSQRGTLRGLHYQISQVQGKLIRVVVGEIFDVVVDIRRGSPSFGQWMGEVLSAENKYQLWIPPGFAHGMYVLSETTEVIYKMTGYYVPEWERTLLWNDPEIGIEWPLIEGQALILNEKDKHGKYLHDADLFD
jgi:dTDP-4-dehydrorhamnose 3,5-epimerase